MLQNKQWLELESIFLLGCPALHEGIPVNSPQLFEVVLVFQVISVHFQKTLRQCTESVIHFEEEHLRERCKQVPHRLTVAATWRSGERGDGHKTS